MVGRDNSPTWSPCTGIQWIYRFIAGVVGGRCWGDLLNVLNGTYWYHLTTSHAWHTAMSYGRDEKKGQKYAVHGNRKQCWCSAKYEVATRAIADDWKWGQKYFYGVSQHLCSLCVSRWDQPFFCTKLASELLNAGTTLICQLVCSFTASINTPGQN